MTTFVSSRHPLPGSSGSTRVWLRWPYLAVCDGALVQVFDAAAGAEGGSSAGNAAEGAPLQCLRRFSLARYNTGAAASGRGANVLHGLDVRAGCLVGGTASGTVLHVKLAGDGGPATYDAEPTVHELNGHTKVVSCVQLARNGGDDGLQLAYSSSLDKTVRQWSLRDGACLQVIKAGTAVLAIALLPPTPQGPQLLMGCNDGTVRMWESGGKKAARAVSTLRHQHDSYVGALQLSSDGERLLSCARSGQLQLWRRHEKEGFAADADGLQPSDAANVADAWRLDVLSSGLLAVSAAGGVAYWAWGTRAAQPLRPDALASSLLDQPCESHVEEDAARPGRATLVFAGLRHATEAAEAATATAATLCLEVHRCADMRIGDEPPGGGGGGATPTAAPASGGASDGQDGASGAFDWPQMRALALELGVEPDDDLQQQLVKMARVAQATGRELSESSVRTFLQRRKAKSGDGSNSKAVDTR